jgi:NUC153 domain
LLDKDSKKPSGAVDKLMQDDRFKSMFENKEFEIDKNAEAYRLLKSGNVNKKVKEHDVDSVGSGDEEEEPAVKGRDLNKLFSGKGEEEEDGSQGSGEDDDDF